MYRVEAGMAEMEVEEILLSAAKQLNTNGDAQRLHFGWKDAQLRKRDPKVNAHEKRDKIHETFSACVHFYFSRLYVQGELFNQHKR